MSSFSTYSLPAEVQGQGPMVYEGQSACSAAKKGQNGEVRVRSRLTVSTVPYTDKFGRFDTPSGKKKNRNGPDMLKRLK